jgi:hypothetical protein
MCRNCVFRNCDKVETRIRCAMELHIVSP